MGTGGRNIKMMKTFAIVLLAAVAFAEPEAKPKADADPYLLYGGYGLGHLGYAGYYGYPYAHYGYWGRKRRSAEAEPTAAADPEADPYRYRGFGRYYGGYRGRFGGRFGRKRRSAEPEAEATADPKADPYLLYGGYYGHGYGLGYYGYPYGGYYWGK